MIFDNLMDMSAAICYLGSTPWLLLFCILRAHRETLTFFFPQHDRASKEAEAMSPKKEDLWRWMRRF